MPKSWDPSANILPLFQMFPDVESQEQADIYYPMYSPWSVGMPLPGPDFCAWAEMRSGQKPPKGFGKGAPAVRNKFIEWLEIIYRVALYKMISLPVAIKNRPNPGTAKFVPGSPWGERAMGPTQSEVMVIGKHPGWEEAHSGMNFSGPTSIELVQALEELEVENRHLWYMTNVVRFPHLDAKHSATLPSSWIKDCLPLLHQEFRLVRPKFCLLLGDDAIKTVLGRSHNLSSTAGQVFELTIPLHEFDTEDPVWHTIKVMACMHPARVARQPDLYPQFLGGLRQFIALTRGEQVGKKETDLEHYELYDEEQLAAWTDLVIAEKAKMFAVDCEWHGSYATDAGAYLRTVQVAWGPKKAATIVVRNAVGDQFRGNWVNYLYRVLKNTSDRKVRIAGHNFRADLPWLLHAGLDLRPEFEVPVDDPDPDGVTRLYGWQKTATEGAIDTLLAVHAWQETHPLGLEACTSQLLGMPRYDIPLEEWKNQTCRDLKIGKSELPGYGECPDEILHPYGNYDADSTWRLADLIDRPGGLLDKDRFGNNSREAYWIAMRASPAFLEMEMTGVCIDRRRAEELTDLYMFVRDERLEELRRLLNWPTFNPSASRHRVELLFGEQFNTKRGVKLRPTGAKSLYLEPVKSTGKRAKMWKDLIEISKRDSTALERYNPSTDKETMGILASTPGTGKDWQYDMVRKLRDISFLNQLLRTVLRPHKLVEASNVVNSLASIGEDTPIEVDSDTTEEIPDVDEAGNRVYEKGIISEIHDDGRVRPHFSQTAETGRAKCSRPNLQNWSKRREPDYLRIAANRYKYPLRSIIVPSPGCVLIEADYSAAEVAGVAWMSGDPLLIEHARRSALDESHQDYFDIHSNVAVRAFRLTCEPTKKGLKSAGKSALRTAAKAVFFGYLYGQGAESAARKAREEGADVTRDDAQALIDSLTASYPRLAAFFDECKHRSEDPGWLQNCFGRFRRFMPSLDRQVIGESQRQAMNFPIQSLVADAVSRALDFIYTYRVNNPVQYKIVLQIHDAVILEVPIPHLLTVYKEVLPKCMTDMVEVWPSYLNGERQPDVTTPYHLGIGRDVYFHWGEDIPMLANSVFGIPSEFCNEKVSNQGIFDLLKIPGWDAYANQTALQAYTEEQAMKAIASL